VQDLGDLEEFILLVMAFHWLACSSDRFEKFIASLAFPTSSSDMAELVRMNAHMRQQGSRDSTPIVVVPVCTIVVVPVCMVPYNKCILSGSPP
jgi:hypothetical protein